MILTCIFIWTPPSMWLHWSSFSHHHFRFYTTIHFFTSPPPESCFCHQHLFLTVVLYCMLHNDLVSHMTTMKIQTIEILRLDSANLKFVSGKEKYFVSIAMIQLNLILFSMRITTPFSTFYIFLFRIWIWLHSHNTIDSICPKQNSHMISEFHILESRSKRNVCLKRSAINYYSKI